MSHKSVPLDRCVGEGISKKINMPSASNVFTQGKRGTRIAPISRDPGQDESHMKIKTDDGTLNKRWDE